MNITEIITAANSAVRRVLGRVELQPTNRVQTLELIVIHQQMQIENLQKLVAEMSEARLNFYPELPRCGDEDDVQWIVNDIAELGVMIHGQAFFLYKGHSLVYEDATHDETGEPRRYRPVFKREFGECAHLINYKNLNLIGTVSLDDSDEWRVLPAAVSKPPVQGKEQP